MISVLSELDNESSAIFVVWNFVYPSTRQWVRHKFFSEKNGLIRVHQRLMAAFTLDETTFECYHQLFERCRMELLDKVGQFISIKANVGKQ